MIEYNAHKIVSHENNLLAVYSRSLAIYVSANCIPALIGHAHVATSPLEISIFM